MSAAASITGRIVNGDITIMNVGATDVLAIFREANWEVSVDEIDVSVAKDIWKQREVGLKDWRFTLTKLISASEVFGTLVINGGLCSVTTDIGGKDFKGTGIITGVTMSAGDPQNEQVNVVSAGGTPTLTA